jgi:hypothetical protein
MRTPVPRFTSPTVDGYRVAVRPLVVIEPRANDDYLEYTVHFRLNKALRPLREGGAGVNASVMLSGLWAERVFPEGMRSRNCYEAGVSSATASDRTPSQVASSGCAFARAMCPACSTSKG